MVIMEIPCEGCITLAICRTIYLGYDTLMYECDRALIDRCSLIEDYVITKNNKINYTKLSDIYNFFTSGIQS